MDKIFMCSPNYYTVSYVINPWMCDNVDNCMPDLAQQQWQNLHNKISEVASTYVIKQTKNLPDMVFTANAGLVRGRKVILSRFKHEERSGEESKFMKFFVNQGFTTIVLPAGVYFEGAGDALWDRYHHSMLWMGYGHRTDFNAKSFIGELFQCAVQPLQLVDERFYHLDTCFCPLTGGEIMYYPPAFDDRSLAAIRGLTPENRRIEVSEEDALNFACNAVSIGRHVFMNKFSPELGSHLKKLGYITVEVPMSEFMKAGGAAKCLTLRLNEE